jgi:hypothetical protein
MQFPIQNFACTNMSKQKNILRYGNFEELVFETTNQVCTNTSFTLHSKERESKETTVTEL